MTETDDKLLRQFFAEQKQEIADDGFSKQVIANLPNRVKKLSNAWVSFCSAVALVLFFAFDGLYVTSDLLRQLYIAAVQFFATTPIDLKSVIIVAAALLFAGMSKLFSME